MKVKHLLLHGAALWSLFTALNPACAQGLAFTTNTCIVGHDPHSVAAGDVNGDNTVDLVCANLNDYTLTVLTNNGSGVFGSNATLNVGLAPYYVTLADINGDGKPDLICANAGAHGMRLGYTLTILTNDGSGVFGSNATLNVGAAPQCVVAADVNGNGKLDLISANFYDDTLTVLTNNGSGVFGSNATLNVGLEPEFVLAADLNGDGKVDLISASAINTLTVLTNNGSGSFGSNATLNVGNSCVAAADINGNGKRDLITVDSFANSLIVYTNNGSGLFGSNATITVGMSPQFVIAADVNGDGKPDLISANLGDNTLTVLTNNGSGGFGFNATLNVGNMPDCVVAADVNNDGKLDLISANLNGSSLGSLTVLTQVTVGPPTLAIALSGTNAVLSWSSFSTGFAILTNSDLITTNWVTAGYPLSISNGTNLSTTITLPPLGNLFFKLQQ